MKKRDPRMKAWPDHRKSSWSWRGVNSPQEEEWAKLFKECKDAPPLTPVELAKLTANPIKRYRYPRVAQLIANDVKLDLTLSRTKACRLSAYRECVRVATGYKIRKSDMAQIIPYALELCFIATDDERSAKILASSGFAVDSSHDMATPRLTTDRFWWRLFGFGPTRAVGFEE